MFPNTFTDQPTEEKVEIFLTALAAFGTLATAAFMYPNFVSSRPLVTAHIQDVSGANKRGSQGERLQQEGWFTLFVDIKAPANIVIYPRSVSVVGAKISEDFKLPSFIEPGDHHSKFLNVRPKNPEQGELTVLVRFGLFRWVRVKCPYKRTHWFGE